MISKTKRTTGKKLGI